MAGLSESDRNTLNTVLEQLLLSPAWREVEHAVVHVATGDIVNRSGFVLDVLRGALLRSQQKGVTRTEAHLRS